MISEYFATLGAKSVPGAQEAGLVREAAAIRARYKRCSAAWQEHIDNTRRRIIEALATAPKEEHIIVLGAGAMIDLPVNILRKHPGGVTLIDAVFLRSTLRQMSEPPQLHHQLFDVTGLLESWARQKEGMPVEHTPPGALPATNRPGLVISVNMLSQILLPFMPARDRSSDDIYLAYDMVRAHLALLRSAGCPALLITDFARFDTRKGRSHRSETVPYDALPGEPETIWNWTVAPLGEAEKGVTTTLKVGSWWITT